MIFVVIGILVAIGFVGWGTATKWVRDRAREGDVVLWSSTFDSYKGRTGVYPALPVDSATPMMYCLGTFTETANKCGQYGSSSTNESFPGSNPGDPNSIVSLVKRVSPTPVNSGLNVEAQLVGPLIYVTQNTDTPPITVTANFVNFFETGCPKDWINRTSASPYNLMLNGITTNAIICSLEKTFTYDPN